MEDTKEARMTEAVFTDELMEEMRSKKGIKLRIDHCINNKEATGMSIKKFAYGIGDPNPLWVDEEYARATRYKGIVAPPSWVISVYAGIQFGWRGIGAFHNASTLWFYKPVRLDDKILPECIYNGFDGPKPSKFAGKMVIDLMENRYYNQRGEAVARIDWTVIRVERGKSKEKKKYHHLTLPHPWKEEELKEIEEEVLAEGIRGSVPRYWEDVQEGDALGPVVKGPIGVTDEIAFLIGGGAPIPQLAAHGVMLRQYRKHPAWSFRDPNTGALEPVYSVHYNKYAALAMGVPSPYDVGFQRQCWQIHLLTNWMGDEGWIKKAYAEYRLFVYHSDVIRIKGKVTRKYVDADGELCVDVDTVAINQRGENVMPGCATIVLPSREKRTSPLDSRL